jgi:hypothetical protein
MNTIRIFRVDVEMERNTSASSRSKTFRSASRNKKNMNDKEKRTTSLQRRRSVLSIAPSSRSIQKPERGRSRSHIVINDVVSVAVKSEHHFLVVHCLC